MEQLTLVAEEVGEILRLPTAGANRLLDRFRRLLGDSPRFAQLVRSSLFAPHSLGEELQKYLAYTDRFAETKVEPKSAAAPLATDCGCTRLEGGPSDWTALGRDEYKGRFGDVSIGTCPTCGRTWLKYFIEDHWAHDATRWFRGVLPSGMESAVTPDNAVAVLESLEWYYQGGRYFQSAGERSTGKVLTE